MQFGEPHAHLAHIPERYGSPSAFTILDMAVPISLMLRAVQRAFETAKNPASTEPFEERSVGKETCRDKVDSRLGDGPND